MNRITELYHEALRTGYSQAAAREWAERQHGIEVREYRIATCREDPFLAFARRDLEAKGVDSATAARVVAATYGED